MQVEVAVKHRKTRRVLGIEEESPLYCVGPLKKDTVGLWHSSVSSMGEGMGYRVQGVAIVLIAHPPS